MCTKWYDWDCDRDRDHVSLHRKFTICFDLIYGGSLFSHHIFSCEIFFMCILFRDLLIIKNGTKSRRTHFFNNNNNLLAPTDSRNMYNTYIHTYLSILDSKFRFDIQFSKVRLPRIILNF